MPLEHLCTAKFAEIECLKAQEAAGTLPACLTTQRPDFSAALRQSATGLLPVIAEYKRASPSRGLINDSLEPEEVAAQYQAAGAACISVLTEEEHFRGDLDYVRRMAALPALARTPLLRKDFIFHPLQVRATAATAASALLLMVRLTPDAATLRSLRELTEQLGMEAVVEVFDRDELRLARASGARIIQVNARDLATLAVSREACLALAQAERGKDDTSELWIAASGVSTPSHLREAAAVGYDAALVGTALMAGGHPGTALRDLLGIR